MMEAIFFPKHRFLQKPHGVSSQKTAFLISVLNRCGREYSSTIVRCQLSSSGPAVLHTRNDTPSPASIDRAEPRFDLNDTKKEKILKVRESNSSRPAQSPSHGTYITYPYQVVKPIGV
jgi:hypothetical protein